jgi:hypothetical protein
MKVKYLAAIAAASVLGLGVLTGCSGSETTAPAGGEATETAPDAAAPCAGANPCAAKENPCAGANPCAAKENPCAGANPCAAKENPCAGANPCAAPGQ